MMLPDRLRDQEKWLSFGLAAAMHLGLFIFLVYGIRWQTEAPVAVEVELYRSVPLPVAVPQPPEPVVRPEPKVEPKREPPPVIKPDIAIKKAPEKPEPKPLPKPEVKPEPKSAPRPDPNLDKLLSRELEQLNTRSAVARADQDLAQMKAGQAAAARNKGLAGYADKIRAAIRSKLSVPPDVKGNPEAEFDVVQLPGGEVLSVKLKKSSGSKALDEAIERAIMRASPLPKPDDPSLFQRNLDLKFKPLDE